MIRIDDLTVDAADWPDQYGHSYIWRATDVPRVETGQDDAGRILVTLDVDGILDIVSADLHQTGHLGGLERAITALTQVRDGLARAYQGLDDPGRCFRQGEWGRCLARLDHPTDHQFPTEHQWRSLSTIAREAS